MRIGAVGIDSSHLPEFTRRMKELNAAKKTRCLVTHVFDPGGHDLPKAAEWLAKTKEMGVQQVGSMDELLKSVDGVMVLSVNGSKHLALSLPSLERGLPTYIDKPLTCNLSEAKQLLATARKPVREMLQRIKPAFPRGSNGDGQGGAGRAQSDRCIWPGRFIALMEGLFFYGVHAIEMVDASGGRA